MEKVFNKGQIPYNLNIYPILSPEIAPSVQITNYPLFHTRADRISSTSLSTGRFYRAKGIFLPDILEGEEDRFEVS